MYVRVHGHLKSFQGKTTLNVFSIRYKYTFPLDFLEDGFVTPDETLTASMHFLNYTEFEFMVIFFEIELWWATLLTNNLIMIFCYWKFDYL